MKESLVGHNALIFPCGSFQVKLEYRPGMKMKPPVRTRTGSGINDWKITIFGMGPWVALVRRDENDQWLCLGAGDLPEAAIEMAKRSGAALYAHLEVMTLLKLLEPCLTVSEAKTMYRQSCRAMLAA